MTQMNHLGEIASILTAAGVLLNALMTLWGNFKMVQVHRQNEQIVEATNGMLKGRIAAERRQATAEGKLAGRAEAKKEAKGRGDVRGKN